ncbi:hypothetical protein [Pseudomonas oryzihabitans]|uniref:hypothetical protein n=1 Tax=Pseudomonas oryzihabitans TaxID=47885 RepID=UPI001123BF31|nr:hypothetical protein [Pseudomonas psychrotolerans]QDD90215.1 hypothetical protein CCZ28_14800 [Pseudomonas psychrotolerans]
MKASLPTLALAWAMSPLYCAVAADATNTPPTGGFVPTPGMITMKTLIDAGVLVPMLSDEYFGLHQARIGESRNNTQYGDNQSPGKPLPRFRDDDQLYIAPLTLTHELPASSGANFVRVAITGTKAYADHSAALENDGTIKRAALQFLHAPTPDRIYGVGLTYTTYDFDNLFNRDPLGSHASTGYRGWGLQAMVAQDFAGPLAAFARAEYTKGESKFSLTQNIAPGVSIPVHYSGQSDDHLYLESQLVGTWDSRNASWMPANWVLHPVLGATFQRDFIAEATTNQGTRIGGAVGSTEDYGLVFSKVVLEKKAAFSPDLQVTPRFTLGVEHEYVNDLDRYLSDPTALVSGIGLGLSKFGQRLDIDYTRRDGLDNKRDLSTLVVALSFVF